MIRPPIVLGVFVGRVYAGRIRRGMESIDEETGGAGFRRAFDMLDWPDQVRCVASHPMDAGMMRHVARHGDPAARMALALRRDLPPTIRRLLETDANPQVRANLAAGADCKGKEE